jgi:multidrug efflux system outer membrane protein
MRPLAPLALLSLVAACAMGPDYERPRVETPPAMSQAAAETSLVPGKITVTTDEPLDRWWTLFGDPQLEKLVREARSGNQDLRAAVARVHAARAMVREAFAPLLPNVQARGFYSYNRFPPNAIPFQIQSGTPGTPPPTITTQPFQLWVGGGEMSYELDVWGKLRRGLEAAQADEAATEEDRKTVEITLVSEVAETYFDLGQAVADLEIFEEGVRVRERTLALTKERFEGGIAPELDVRRARSELAHARALVPDAERRRAVAEHALAVLLGHPPVLHFDGRAPASFALPPELPVGIPATLVERRPDIRAAENRLRARNARVGEAIASFLPEFSLFGRAGYASIDASKLAQPDSQFFSVGPHVIVPIFEGGRLYARKLEAEANTDEATALYEKTVQTALREIADAIVGIDAEEKVRDAQTVNVAEATTAAQLVTEQYERGTSNYLNVLDAQRTLLEARRELVQAQRDLLGHIVGLERALGGGWTPAERLDEEGERHADGE